MSLIFSSLSQQIRASSSRFFCGHVFAFCQQEGTGLEMEILSQQFANEGKDSSDESLQVALLADLQQRQDSEAQHVLNDLVEKVRLSAN